MGITPPGDNLSYSFTVVSVWDRMGMKLGGDVGLKQSVCARMRMSRDDKLGGVYVCRQGQEEGPSILYRENDLARSALRKSS